MTRGTGDEGAGNSREVYWQVQFKHRDRASGKDRAARIFWDEHDELGVLEQAIHQARQQGFSPHGEYRVYVYKDA